jgi:nucleotide-binding universal stress UspA family protein
MPISDILIYVDNSSSWPSRAAAALDLARRHDAHLIGLGVKEPIPAVYAGDGASYGAIAELMRMRERELEEDKARFEEAMRTAGYEPNSEWREGAGDAVLTLALHARYVDLTVVSQGDPESDDVYRTSLPGDLALTSGRPVLVIPYIGAQAPIGRRILVAWSGSRESARAVGDSLDLLREAEEVRVLTISERAMRETSNTDLARYLARHGVRAEVETIGSGGVDIGDGILNVASERGSDLIVMGCYGHSRLREAVFGGVSRTLLRTMTVPVLMSH